MRIGGTQLRSCRTIVQVVHLAAHHQGTLDGAGGTVTRITGSVIICSRINWAVVGGGMEAEKGGPVKEKN
jgi:hypothetical protein